MTKSLTENPDNAIDGSDTKADGNRAWVSDVEKDENGSVVVVTKRVVVESTLDVDSGLVDTKKDEKGVLSSAIITNAVVRGKNAEKVAENGGNGKEQRVINGEEMEDSNNVFRVGDLVWCKIKRYPWWPGQIYDSKDASAFALKHSQEGCLLVACFGDGSCSWCFPSQLVPFVDNFEQMSMDSSFNGLMNAKQKAVDEIGRLVEYNMLCKCIPSVKKAGLARPVVSNVGVKRGVLVPDVDIHRLSIPKYEPAKIHENLMSYAKGVDVDSLLEVAVLKSRLSAFYGFKGGGYRMPEFCEPVLIEGLEDKTVTASNGDFSVPIQVPALSTFLEGDWLNSPAVKSRASSNDIVYHRRQKKCVPEIMEENKYSAIKPKSQKGAKVKDKNASFGVKSRKSDATDKSVHGVKKGHLSRKPNEIKIDVAENVSDEELPIIKLKAVEKISSTKARKKIKYLSPPHTNHAWTKENWGFDKSTKIQCSTSAPISDEELPIIKLKAVDVRGQRVENEKKLTFSVSDVNVQVNELLSGVELAAVNPMCLSKKGSLQSSTYLHGTDYKTYRKCRKGGKKRKYLEGQEDDFKTPKAAKTEGETKPVKSKSKKSSEFSSAKSSMDKRASEDPGSSQEMTECMSDVIVIKQKIETMTATLENYHSKFLTEEKMSLKDEMKQLMEDVDMVTKKVRITV